MAATVGLVVAYSASNQPAHAAPPPPSGVSRIVDTASALAIYDRGNNTQVTMGGQASATRWTRQNCGTRHGFFVCNLVSQASGRCLTRSIGTLAPLIITQACGGFENQFFTDPPSILNDYDTVHDPQNSRVLQCEAGPCGMGSVVGAVVNGTATWVEIPG